MQENIGVSGLHEFYIGEATTGDTLVDLDSLTGVEEGYFHILFTCIVGIQVIKVRVRYAVVGYNH